MSWLSESLTDIGDSVSATYDDAVESVSNLVDDTLESLSAFSSDTVNMVDHNLTDFWQSDLAQYTVLIVGTVTVGPLLAVIALNAIWPDEQLTAYATVATYLTLYAVWPAVVAPIDQTLSVISQDYREWKAQIFNQVSEVARALGLSGEYLQLLLHDAQLLSYSTTALFGAGYDLSELAWYENMDGYLTKFNTKLEVYAEHPEEILLDMGEWIERPAVEAQGAFMAAFVKSVKDVSDHAIELEGKITDVRDALDKTAHDIGGKVGRQISDALAPVFKEYDEFIHDTYGPTVGRIHESLTQLTHVQEQLQYQQAHQAAKIANPGDLMLGILDLTAFERDRQQAIVAKMALGPVQDAQFYTNQYVDSSLEARFALYEDRLDEKRPAPPKLTLLENKIEHHPASRYKRNSWFVGDY